jgi:uncharacterized protein YbjT (DUF2867 family)
MEVKLRVLLTGATGLIGSTVAGRLQSQGHELITVTRAPPSSTRAGARNIVLDMANVTRLEDWLPHLEGVDAVINCAGVLQDSPRDSTAGVHVRGAVALFNACVAAKVDRIIHLSAIGVDRDATTEFSRTKLAADKALMALGLDWVILRPSVVLGRPAYGGSALFRGLAALPFLPVAQDTGPLQVVRLEDLVDTILFFLKPQAPTRQVVEIVGRKAYSMTELAQLFRRWLGWRPARIVQIPRLVSAAMYSVGDAVSLLGWRPPIRTTARREITRGATGDPAPWIRLTGIEPRSLEAAFASEPSSVQERWFSQLYLLKALVLGVLALFWIGTGVVSLGPGWEIGKAMMKEGGVGEPLAQLTIIAGALADIVIGIGIAFRRTTRNALYAGVGLSLAYAAIGTVLLPRLWADPLGPMWKIWPIIVLLLVALAIREER